MIVYKMEDAITNADGTFEFPESSTSKAPEPETPRTLIVMCYSIERLAESIAHFERAAEKLKLAYSRDYHIVHDTIVQGSDGVTYHFLIAHLRSAE